MKIQAVSFDFADTLYPHRPRELDVILGAVGDYLRAHVSSPFEFAALRAQFLAVRDRQFKENRATLRENDFEARLAHVAVFLKVAESRELLDPAVVRGASEAYANAFVNAMICPPWLPDLIRQLAADYRLAVVSNYPITAPIVRTLERDGLLPLVQTVVVSADIGYIKPHPSVFEAALRGLNVPAATVVPVGDTWDADIVGAHQAGICTVYTRQWRDEPDPHYGAGGGGVVPVADIADLRELPAVLAAL